MWLRVLAAQFVLGKMREEDRGGGGGRESPLEEVYGRAFMLFLCVAFPLLVVGTVISYVRGRDFLWQAGQDELGMASRVGGNGGVCMRGDGGAQRLPRMSVSETPQRFELSRREVHGFGDVEE